MNRYDERPPRFWRHGRDRDERRFRDDDYRFQSDERSGRTPGDEGRQPFSGNPYSYYPRRDRSEGSGREWRGRDWGRGSESGGGDRWSQRYGQREPYNARGGFQERSRSRAPWSNEGSRYPEGNRSDEGSRYSESQYGGGGRRASFDPYDEPEFGEGPFADTSEPPGYFGTGYYGDGGASYTGGYDQRYRSRNYGSLNEDTFRSSGQREPRRYRSGPKGYTRSDDRIREDICERLMLADSIDSSEVSVAVKDGKVTLEGSVPTRNMKHEIEDLADYTAGVQDVDNRVRVERAGSESMRSSSSGVQTASGITPTSGGSRTTKQ